VPFDEHENSPLSASQSGLASIDSQSESIEEAGGPSAVMLEETPLPRMFLPGKIVHIYTHRGGYKAAFVPRAFRELRRISLAGNMLSDHTCKAYYEGLLEVQTVRSAPEGLPRWTAFDEDDTWYESFAALPLPSSRFALLANFFSVSAHVAQVDSHGQARRTLKLKKLVINTIVGRVDRWCAILARSSEFPSLL
jgi:hypothetical protein